MPEIAGSLAEQDDAGVTVFDRNGRAHAGAALVGAQVLDGCGHMRYLWSILLPLSRPALATLAVYTFLNTWNQYYWPLLIVDHPEWRTTQIGITAFRSSEVTVYNLQMASTIIVMLPTLILLVLGQRQLVRGLTAGAIKG